MFSVKGTYVQNCCTNLQQQITEQVWLLLVVSISFVSLAHYSSPETEVALAPQYWPLQPVPKAPSKDWSATDRWKESGFITSSNINGN